MIVIIVIGLILSGFLGAVVIAAYAVASGKVKSRRFEIKK